MIGNISKFKKLLVFVVLLSVLGSFVPAVSNAQDLYNKSNTGGTLNNNQSGAVNNSGTTPTGSEKAAACSLSVGSSWSMAECIAAPVAQYMLGIAAKVLELSAQLFNYLIDYTLNIKNFINKVPIVYLGWSTFRDFANIIFIFIILYIAINTILGNEGYGIKKLLGKTIIAAMLINFSLFFTNVIIDTSNIFALQFYNKIISGSTSSDADGGISASFVKAMGLQDIFTKDGGTFANSAITSTSATTSTLSFWNIILVGILGSIFILITAFVFLAATGMFLYRSFTLIFLMILSPLAFAGGILPKTQSYAGKWWSKLFTTAFFAPAYMAMLYLVASMVLNLYTSSGNTQNFTTMILGGSKDYLPIILNYVLLNGLMLACLKIAADIGADGSKLAISWGKDIGKSAGGFVGAGVGGATFGLTARMGRRVIGGTASGLHEQLRDSKFATSALGRKTMGALKGVASSTFDVRNTKVGKDIISKNGLGEGIKGGFNENIEEKKKALVEYGKTLTTKTRRDGTKYNAKEEFAKKQFGKASLLGFIQRGNKLAGAELMVSAIDDKIKDDYTERISETGNLIKTYEESTKYKEYDKLQKKVDSGKASPGEKINLSNKIAELKGIEVKYKDAKGDEQTSNAFEVADKLRDVRFQLTEDKKIIEASKKGYKKLSRNGGLNISRR